MGEPHAAFALKRKRDEICRVIAHYERLLREAQHDLAHVNAALRLFEATGEAADLPPYVDFTERPRTGRKNLTNIVEISSPEWRAWSSNSAAMGGRRRSRHDL